MDLNPEWVPSRITHRVDDPIDTTPLGLIASDGLTQGSSFLATLGFVAESRWDSTHAFDEDKSPAENDDTSPHLEIGRRRTVEDFLVRPDLLG
jgi:hypothetical protein